VKSLKVSQFVRSENRVRQPRTQKTQPLTLSSRAYPKTKSILEKETAFLERMTKDPKKMKYLVLVGDGMGDYPLDALGGKTPLEVAKTPNMDRIAACRVGLAKTIPEGMEPGSDVANLSLLGYDPAAYHTGRGPLEAASMGITLQPNQVAFRMNLVTLDMRSDQEIIMVSHSAGDLSTEEAADMVKELKRSFETPAIQIHQGVAYRHLLVWDGGPEKAVTIPPHDVLDQNMASYLRDASGNPVPDMIRRSWELLKEHPINRKRRDKGLKQANSIWPWGQGKAPKLPSFYGSHGLRGGVISAVDLLKGIGVYAGFVPIFVEGATGFLNTNYKGKAEAALENLKALDFVFLHVEAPDEAGHAGNHQEKIQAIENFDRKVVGTVLEGLMEFEDYRIMVVSDHLTPVVKKTHTNEPTPFAWATRDELQSTHEGPPFTEKAAKQSGLLFEKGHTLMASFLSHRHE
jgi:2,3-bisphosphoglycerate-independent phosphoglycerate mutase